MRIVSFGCAALACIGVIFLRWVGAPLGAVWGLLFLAALFLAVGLYMTAQQQQPRVIELDREQREEIQRLVDFGQYGTAVSQVRLWFRNVDQQQAAAIVQDVIGVDHPAARSGGPGSVQ